jgi:hypothetical protein
VKSEELKVNRKKNCMKNIVLPILAMLLLGVGCKPEIEGELGEPFDKLTGMHGTWVIASFIQKDLNNPVKEERDLSTYYVQDGTDPLEINFDKDSRAYTVDLTVGRNYFGDGGDWSFDNDDYPSFLILDTGTDTLQFELGAAVRPYDNMLSLELPRGCDDTETVIYKFEFNRKLQ